MNTMKKKSTIMQIKMYFQSFSLSLYFTSLGYTECELRARVAGIYRCAWMFLSVQRQIKCDIAIDQSSCTFIPCL